jgi:secernin
VCDTSVATSPATADGSVIFAKNSDRKANECQPLCYYPRQKHPAGSVVRCTHREIPQARETYGVLGSRPYWMWGFEIGVNEFGVAAGNEAVYGREGHDEEGLLGMDYLRLGLERGRTAYEALQVIVDLLEQFGQGGIADVIEPRSYHNSFIIADPREAWVLETAGRYWVAERVKGRRAISNCYTIETEWDDASKDLIDHAVAQGWWNRKKDFNFSLAYGDPARDIRSGQCRFRRATGMLDRQSRLEVSDLMSVLRDHESTIVDLTGKASPAPICMHEISPRVGATAASMVVHLRPDQPSPLTAVAWHSFGSPCLSAFHPIYVAAGAPRGDLAVGGAVFDPGSPWWLNERIQRRADAYPLLKPTVQSIWADAERAAFEAARCAEERSANLPPDEMCAELRRVGDTCIEAALTAMSQLDRITQRELGDLPHLSDADLAHWSSLNAPVALRLEARHERFAVVSDAPRAPR